MAKDPAALLYIDKWLVATTEMKADARAYYMDLILFQFDKGSLPNDIEELANICRVRVSEFNNFKQVFEQVLKQKFKQNNEGRLENEFAKEIIQKRKSFLEKRSLSGKMSYVIRYAIAKFKVNEDQIEFIKSNIKVDEIDTKNEQVLKQVLKQTLELYINEDEDENKDIVKNIIHPFETENFLKAWQLFKDFKKQQFKFRYKPIGEQAALKDVDDLSNHNEELAIRIIYQSIKKGWRGLFAIKDSNVKNTDYSDILNYFNEQ